MTRSHRSQIAALGAHEKWARCDDRKEATAPLRRGFEARFLKLADPDGALRAEIEKAGGADSPTGRRLLEQLNQKVDSARKAYFARLALASAKARAEKRGKK